jgi:tetratricopeptide (TPR) repeat protein
MMTDDQQRLTERDADLQMLKKEVDALQIKLLATSTPWYRQASTLIAFFALLFSFGTTLVSLQRAEEQDRRNWKQELRGLILELVALPLKSVELTEKFEGRPLVLGGLQGALNQESLILADQASRVVREIPDLVTAQEYLALAGAFHNGGQLERAKEMRDRAIAVSETPIDAITALRQLGAMAFQQRDFAAGRKHYQDARNYFSSAAPGEDAGVVAFTDSLTEMFWAQAEAIARQCEEFRFHIAEAKKIVTEAGSGSAAEQNLPQIVETESYGCPPMFSNR